MWRAVIEDLAAVSGDGEPWELDARELLILEAAARQADQNRSLEDAIEREGWTVEGSQGQPRLNGAAVELRQGRVALARLLGDLRLPDEYGVPLTAAQRRAKGAQRARQARRYALPPRRIDSGSA